MGAKARKQAKEKGMGGGGVCVGGMRMEKRAWRGMKREGKGGESRAKKTRRKERHGMEGNWGMEKIKRKRGVGEAKGMEGQRMEDCEIEGGEIKREGREKGEKGRQKRRKKGVGMERRRWG